MPQSIIRSEPLPTDWESLLARPAAPPASGVVRSEPLPTDWATLIGDATPGPSLADAAAVPVPDVLTPRGDIELPVEAAPMQGPMPMARIGPSVAPVAESGPMPLASALVPGRRLSPGQQPAAGFPSKGTLADLARGATGELPLTDYYTEVTAPAPPGSRAGDIAANVGKAGVSGLLAATTTQPWSAVEMSLDALGLREAASWAAQVRKDSQETRESLRAGQVGAGPTERAIYSGIESIGAMVPSIVATILTKNPSVGLGMMGVGTGTEKYAELKETAPHMTPVGRFLAGVVEGSAEVLTEKIPLDNLMGDLVGGSGVWQTIRRQVMAEVPGEQVATFTQDANEWAAVNPGKPVAAFLAERPGRGYETLVSTLVATVGMSAGSIALDRGLHKLSTADVVSEGAGGDAAVRTVQDAIDRAMAENATPRGTITSDDGGRDGAAGTATRPGGGPSSPGGAFAPDSRRTLGTVAPSNVRDEVTPSSTSGLSTGPPIPGSADTVVGTSSSLPRDTSGSNAPPFDSPRIGSESTVASTDSISLPPAPSPVATDTPSVVAPPSAPEDPAPVAAGSPILPPEFTPVGEEPIGTASQTDAGGNLSRTDVLIDRVLDKSATGQPLGSPELRTAFEQRQALDAARPEAPPREGQDSNAQLVEPTEDAPRAQPAPVRLSEPPAQPEIGVRYEVPARQLKTAPGTLQYRGVVNAEGVEAERAITTPYDPLKGGVLAVWQDPKDGETYVVNGHHRLSAAKRDDGTVAIVYIKAPTAKEARAYGAVINLQEDNTNLRDAVQYMVDTNLKTDGLEAAGISPRAKISRQAAAIAELEPHVRRQWEDGTLPDDIAAAIGAAKLEVAQQEAAVDFYKGQDARGHAPTVAVMARALDRIKDAPTVEEDDGGQPDIFGNKQTKNVFADRMDLEVYVLKELGKDKSRLRAAIREKDRLARANTKVDVDAAKAIADESARAQAVLNSLMRSKGPISDILNQAATELAEGGDREAIRTRVLADVVVAAEAELGRAGAVDRGRPPQGAGGNAPTLPGAVPERAPARSKAEPAPAEEDVAPEPRKFSSTQVNLPSDVASRVRALASTIPDADLAEDGREADPHITVQYGIDSDDAAPLREALAKEAPIVATLGKTSLFENEDADVVKVDIDSPDLRRVRAAIAKVVDTPGDTHPTYIPHATIAYVKPGKGKAYAGKTDLDGQTITIDRIVFSTRDNQTIEIPLAGEKPRSGPPPGDKQAARAKIAADMAARKQRMAELRERFEKDGYLYAERENGRAIFLAPSARGTAQYQVTSFDPDGTPTGHREYSHLDDGPHLGNALAEFLSPGLTLKDRFAPSAEPETGEAPAPASEPPAPKRKPFDILSDFLPEVGMKASLDAEPIWNRLFNREAKRLGRTPKVGEMRAVVERFMEQQRASHAKAMAELGTGAPAQWTPNDIAAVYRREETREGQGSFDGHVITNTGAELGNVAEMVRREVEKAKKPLPMSQFPLVRGKQRPGLHDSLKWLVDHGVLQQAWNRYGTVYYAPADRTLPAWLNAKPGPDSGENIDPWWSTEGGEFGENPMPAASPKKREVMPDPMAEAEEESDTADLPRSGEPVAFTAENLATIFGLNAEQAAGVIALADAMDLDLGKIQIVLGGEPGSGALPQAFQRGALARLDAAIGATGINELLANSEFDGAEYAHGRITGDIGFSDGTRNQGGRGRKGRPVSADRFIAWLQSDEALSDIAADATDYRDLVRRARQAVAPTTLYQDDQRSMFDEDVLETSERQVRLPGEAGAVRDVENPTPQEPLPLGEFRLTAPESKPKRAKQASLFYDGEPLFQPAYHGSPHIFEAFSLHAIGTGEGAQAYGFGLYFAGDKAVAEYYRKQLSPRRWFYDGEEVARGRDNFWLADALENVRPAAGQSSADALEAAIWALRQSERKARSTYGDVMGDVYKAKADRLAKLDPSKLSYRQGRVYKVDIPEDDVFLDYDKPLSQQSEKVQRAIEALGVRIARDRWEAYQVTAEDAAANRYSGVAAGKWIARTVKADGTSDGWGGGVFGTREGAEGNAKARNEIAPHPEGPSGRQYYQNAGRTPREASAALAAQGIAGIRYLDGASRNRPIKDAKKAFLAALPEDADYNDLEQAITDGAFSTQQVAFLRELKANDWLGFDYPAQAISEALSGRLGVYDPTKALIAAAEALRTDATYNYVVFDDKLVKILEFEQQSGQGAKASVEFLQAGEALMRALTDPEVSSPTHELAHIARRWLLNRDVPAEHRRGISDEDIATAEQWAGAKDGLWDTTAEEKFARGFERYLRDGGPALPSKIRAIFSKFAAWLTDIYQRLPGSALDVEITPAMRQVFDRLVTRKERNAPPSKYKPGNPFAERAMRARERADRLNQPTSQEQAMANAFPLGAGRGGAPRRGASKRIDASVNRAVEAVEAMKTAEYLEAQAEAFDRGEINAQVRRWNAGKQEASDKRAAAQENREARIVKAKAAREGKERWEVTRDVYADSTGSLAGSARKLVENDHRGYVEQALADGKTVPAEVLKDYPDLAPKGGPPTSKSAVEATPDPAKPAFTRGQKVRGFRSEGEVLTVNDATGEVRVKFTSGRMVEEQGAKGYFDMDPRDLEVVRTAPGGHASVASDETTFPVTTGTVPRTERRRSLLDPEPEPAPLAPTGPKALDATRAVELPELVALARELIAVPQVVKRFRKDGKLGDFSPSKGGRIRILADLFKPGNEQQLAKTLAHEIGHLVDWLPDFTLKRGNVLGHLKSLTGYLKHAFTSDDGMTIHRDDVRKELIEVSTLWRGPWNVKGTESYDKYRSKGTELYADALSALLNNPGWLEQKAPIFYAQFFENLDRKPDVRSAYFALQELLSGTREELIARREANVDRMLFGADAKAIDVERLRRAEREQGDQHYWLRFRVQHVDKNAALIDRVKALEKKGITIPEEDDPRYLLEERSYMGGKQKAFLERFIQPLHVALREAGIDWMTFGKALFYERIIAGDRSEMANPLGLAPDSARELYAKLQQGLSAEQMTALGQAIAGFRAVVKGVAEDAYDAGLYRDDLYEQMQKNPAYVAFRVVDYMERDMTSTVHHQIGTLKDIQNPADATVLKMLVTMRAAEYNRMKVASFDLLGQHFPAEIQDAKHVWNGKGIVPVEPDDPKTQVLVTYREKGRLRGKYVDPYVAASLNNESVGRNWAAVEALRWINGKLFRPAFTGLNLGFQTFNFSRDFWRFWKNMPEMSVGRALTLYRKAGTLARVRAYGLKPNATAKQRQAYADLVEAEGAGILSLTFNDIIAGRQTEDTQIEELYAQHGIGGTPTPHRGPLKAVYAIAEWIKNTGDFIETLPKAAAIYQFQGDGAIGDISAADRSFIRRKVGSPDFLAGGTYKPITNEVLLFSNAILQAWRADFEVATDPKTASGFWWKTAMVNVAPKLAIAAFLASALGMGDDDEDDDATAAGLKQLRRALEGISEYDLTNYLSLPLGIDSRGNTVYVRMPQDDSGRLIGGLVWKALHLAQGDVETAKTLGQVFDYMAGQAPGVTPIIQAVGDVATFASGRNPYDPFRNRFLFTEDEMKAGGLPALRKFIGYEFQQFGGSILWKFYPGEDVRPRERTTTQKILELPIVSTVAGRWIKVSSFGHVEKLRGVQAGVQRDEARARAKERSAVADALRTFQKEPPPNRTRATQARLAKEVVNTLYADASPKEREAQYRDVLKKIRMGAARGQSDPIVDTVMSATSTAQRVAIVREAFNGRPAEMERWVRQAVGEQVISKQAAAAIMRAEP